MPWWTASSWDNLARGLISSTRSTIRSLSFFSELTHKQLASHSLTNGILKHKLGELTFFNTRLPSDGKLVCYLVYLWATPIPLLAMYFPKPWLPLINFPAQLTQLLFSPSCSLWWEWVFEWGRKKHNTHLTHRGLFCGHPVRPRLGPTVQSLWPLCLANMPRPLHPTALK